MFVIRRLVMEVPSGCSWTLGKQTYLIMSSFALQEIWQWSARLGQHFSIAVDYENHTATYYMEGDAIWCWVMIKHEALQQQSTAGPFIWQMCNDTVNETHIEMAVNHFLYHSICNIECVLSSITIHIEATQRRVYIRHCVSPTWLFMRNLYVRPSNEF